MTIADRHIVRRIMTIFGRIVIFVIKASNLAITSLYMLLMICDIGTLKILPTSGFIQDGVHACHVYHKTSNITVMFTL